MPEINQVPVESTSRFPRGAVRLSGDDGVTVNMAGWTAWEVENNATRNADTFRVEFVVADLPDGKGIDWFSSQKEMTIEILAGLPTDPTNFQLSELDSLIYGGVDEVAFNPVTGKIELHGRDFTSKLIDTKTSEHYANKTSSQIAVAIAKKYGLEAVVTTTNSPSGDYYKEDHIRTQKMQSEWELLTDLANSEDFLVYVKGKELHFEPKPKESDSYYVIHWDAKIDSRFYPISNTIDLQFTRALTVAKGVTVEVLSWNSKQKNGFSAFYPKASRSVQPGQSSAKTQLYKYTIPGLTLESAQKRAQALYSQIIRHEVRLTAYMPADQLLDTTKTILVRGTSTNFDQTYYPESIKRSMSMHEGYRMYVTAKNKSPETEE